MSEMSHKRARSLIQQAHLTEGERQALAGHIESCAECRHYARVHMYLVHNLQLEAVRTHPTPEMRAAILQQVQKQQRRNLVLVPLRSLPALVLLAAIVLAGWLLLRAPANQPSITQPVVTSEPTRTPRPTLTPLPTRFQEISRQVTTAEELAGVWGYQRGPGFESYYQFTQDGAVRMASSGTRDRLENSPSITGTYWFEDAKLNLNWEQNSRTQVVSCIDIVGVYEVYLLENGNLRFETVADECSWRSQQFSDHDAEPVELRE